jgi:hypothetical protein
MDLAGIHFALLDCCSQRILCLWCCGHNEFGVATGWRKALIKEGVEEHSKVKTKGQSQKQSRRPAGVKKEGFLVADSSE